MPPRNNSHLVMRNRARRKCCRKLSANEGWSGVKKISSSNTIKSSDSHKNYIKEQWRRRTRAKGPTQIALRELLTCPHSSVVQNFFLLKNHFSLLWGKKLQTQLRLLLMWQAGELVPCDYYSLVRFPTKIYVRKKKFCATGWRCTLPFRQELAKPLRKRRSKREKSAIKTFVNNCVTLHLRW